MDEHMKAINIDLDFQLADTAERKTTQFCN
jgi:hypothetical protein